MWPCLVSDTTAQCFFSVCPFWSSCLLICRPLFWVLFLSDFLSFFTLLLLAYPLLLITINNMRLSNSRLWALTWAWSTWMLPLSTKTIQTCQRIPGNFQKHVIYLLFFKIWVALFLSMLIMVLFPRSPLWKGSEVPRIASYLISPSACGHMVARLRKKRQSGTILIIPTF